MQIYTHARNVRFLPHLEALEPSRRDERTNALASALGVPRALINVYLAEMRRHQEPRTLTDSGNELLYERESVQDISAAAEKLGAAQLDRMRKLLQMRGRSSSK